MLFKPGERGIGEKSTLLKFVCSLLYVFPQFLPEMAADKIEIILPWSISNFSCLGIVRTLLLVFFFCLL